VALCLILEQLAAIMRTRGFLSKVNKTIELHRGMPHELVRMTFNPWKIFFGKSLKLCASTRRSSG
jgi:hypothetical protein